LREANDELEAFAYSASHDMAAPLRVIEGLSRILIEDYEDRLDENGIVHLTTIDASADRLLALLQDLLVLSRVRTPTKDDVKRVEVGMLVDQIAKDRKADFAENARVLVGGDLPVVEAPPERIRQVLENLITNGFKYNDSQPPVVSISGWTEGSIGVVRVEDNGIGIPEHEQELCFGLFTRLHSNRFTPGSGDLKRPGFDDCSCYWVTASSAGCF
jgi:light-regulated signal transduction histidine kinase (bacteriophytochrome)